MNEELKCLAGIQKCDEFLKGCYIAGRTIEDDTTADKIPPDEVAEQFGWLQRRREGKDYALSLAIFYANAKQGFIMRLARMRELEKQTAKMEAC